MNVDWPYVQRPGGLAPDGAPAADLSDLIYRLVNRLGPGEVYRMQSLESDVPECSQQAVSVYTPLVPAGHISPWTRPIRLLDQPEPIETLAMLPDHPPKAFT